LSQVKTSWDRSFRLWDYSVSHSTLLLRSVDSGSEMPSRIDVAFFGVRALHLRDDYRSLSIEKVSEVFADGVLDVTVTATEPVARYLVNGGPDYVLATNVAWEEDEGDHRSPSRFGPLRGTP
jgi:hypothetical protein